MKLNIIKNGKNTRSYADNDAMCSLESILDEGAFPIVLKKEIEEDIRNKNYITYTFNNSGFEIIDQDTLELIHFPDEERYRLKIPIEVFWKALYEYEKIMEKEWHKIVITYDGNDVHFEVE